MRCNEVIIAGCCDPFWSDDHCRQPDCNCNLLHHEPIRPFLCKMEIPCAAHAPSMTPFPETTT